MLPGASVGSVVTPTAGGKRAAWVSVAHPHRPVGTLWVSVGACPASLYWICCGSTHRHPQMMRGVCCGCCGHLGCLKTTHQVAGCAQHHTAPLRTTVCLYSIKHQNQKIQIDAQTTHTWRRASNPAAHTAPTRRPHTPTKIIIDNVKESCTV